MDSTLNSDKWQIVTSKTHLDRHNDYIQIYVMQHEYSDEFTVSDCGDTMADIAQSGVDMEDPDFKARIDEALEKHDVCMELDDSLWLDAVTDDLSERQEKLFRAIVEVNKIVEQKIVEQNI